MPEASPQPRHTYERVSPSSFKYTAERIGMKERLKEETQFSEIFCGDAYVWWLKVHEAKTNGNISPEQEYYEMRQVQESMIAEWQSFFNQTIRPELIIKTENGETDNLQTEFFRQIRQFDRSLYKEFVGYLVNTYQIELTAGNTEKNLDELGAIISTHYDVIIPNLPQELILKLSEAWVIYTAKERKEFEQALKEGMVERKEMMIKILTGKGYCTEAQIDRAFKETTFIITDPIFDRLNKHLGRHAPDQGKISISILSILKESQGDDDKIPELIVDTVVHEILHALAGRSVLEKTEFDNDNRKTVNLYHQRGGFQINPLNRESEHQVERFRWLNEAVTEELTIMLSGKQQETNIYWQERRLLYLVLNLMGEQTPELFFKAYFDDQDTHKPKELRMKNWHKLMQTISKRIGVGFLVKLDKFINSQTDEQGQKITGIEALKKVVEIFEQTGQNFPKYLDEKMTGSQSDYAA